MPDSREDITSGRVPLSVTARTCGKEKSSECIDSRISLAMVFLESTIRVVDPWKRHLNLEGPETAPTRWRRRNSDGLLETSVTSLYGGIWHPENGLARHLNDMGMLNARTLRPFELLSWEEWEEERPRYFCTIL